MKYKAYPKYKDSGVEWIGDVPEHWEVKRIKQIGSIRYGLGEPPEYVDNGLPFIRATDIKRGKIDLEAVKKVNPDDIPWNRKPELKLNEILVVRSGAYTGDSAIVTEDIAGCIVGYDMVLTVKAAHQPFIAWVLLSKYMLQGQIYLERLRAAQPHLNAEELGSFIVLVPPNSQQQVIADFLNSETNKIDTLLGKKQALIGKLKEKRTALISRTVTRGLPPEAAWAAGLDPHPKLKPSGVEWLGDVAEHWEIKKGRHLGILLGSVSPSEENYTDNENGIAFAKVDDLNHIDSSFFLLNTTNRIEGYAASHRKLILFPKRGAAIFTNKVAIAEGNFLFDSNIMGWEIIPSNETKYVAYCLIARRLDDLADVSTVPQINNKHIYPALFPRPPIKEQCLIVDFLEDATHKIDQLITKVEAAIERLQEYRTALITAAVTGKIDVRETQA